jgi:uncharacterized protein (TIGR03435 family)
MRSMVTTLILLGGSAAFAQTFEVASIKPAAPQSDGRIMVRMGGDPGRIDYVNVSLRDLIRQAYGVKDYQVVAPDWMNSTRFDVQAKLPPDTPQEQRNVMMQALLAERFGLKVHKESKEVPVYSLVVGKNGPKLKKAADTPPPPLPNVATPPLPAGGRGPGPGRPGMTRMMMQPGGKMHVNATGMALSSFAEMLSRQVGKPVFDDTGITGFYDIDLDFKPEEGMGMMGGMPTPKLGDSGGEAHGPALDNVEAPSIFTAIQDQLGLKLEGKKGPIETVIVDHAEKVPTEN